MTVSQCWTVRLYVCLDYIVILMKSKFLEIRTQNVYLLSFYANADEYIFLLWNFQIWLFLMFLFISVFHINHKYDISLSVAQLVLVLRQEVSLVVVQNVTQSVERAKLREPSTFGCRSSVLPSPFPVTLHIN